MLLITPAERIVLELLAADTPDDGIASHLRVTEHEVDAYLSALFSRMGAASRAQAVAWAERRGLLVTKAATNSSPSRKSGPQTANCPVDTRPCP